MQRLIQLTPTYKMRLCCLLWFLSVSVLCAPTSYSWAQEEKNDICTTYLLEIVEIEKMREMLRIGSEMLTLRYEAGEITLENLENTLNVWRNTEVKLKSKVSKLYDVARQKKCFEKKVLKR